MGTRQVSGFARTAHGAGAVTIDVKKLLRENGLCGRVFHNGLGEEVACILDIGHDDGLHDHGWRVFEHIEPDPYARDSRQTVTTYRVSDGTMCFETSKHSHAEWLAETLMKLSQ
jgi:hypothetical protein